MPKQSNHDLAGLLIEKANEDLVALRALIDRNEVADSIVGFHAQQAVEKSLKAVLADQGISYGRSHSIEYLLELVGDRGIELPFDAEQAGSLTGWSVEFRYEHPNEAPALDREAAHDLVTAVHEWAVEVVHGS